MLTGLKTEVRAPIKMSKLKGLFRLGGLSSISMAFDSDDMLEQILNLAPIRVGDYIWVQEPFWEEKGSEKSEFNRVVPAEVGLSVQASEGKRWVLKRNLLMPSYYNRITLKVTDVRLQRLHDITEQEIFNEGCSWCSVDIGDVQNSTICNSKPAFFFGGSYGGKVFSTPTEAFIHDWDKSCRSKGAKWLQNPYVWCYKFELIRENIDRICPARLKYVYRG